MTTKKSKEKKDHYSTLGVDKKASQEAIKKAFRAKAKALHPDKQKEDGEEIRALTIAYGVIGDEEKRKVYDEGGVAEAGGVEQKIRNALIEYFNQAFLLEVEDVVGYIKGKIKGMLEQIEQGEYNARRVREKTIKRGKMIRWKGKKGEELNVAQLVIEQHLVNIDATLQMMKVDKEVAEGVLRELEKYEMIGGSSEVRGMEEYTFVVPDYYQDRWGVKP